MSDNLADAAHQLNTLWKSGRDKYVSFFTILGQGRTEVGSDALNQWCVTNLRLHIDTIVRILGLLRETDAQREKLALKDALDAKRKTDAEVRARKAEERQQKETIRETALAEKRARQEAAELERERRRRNKAARESYHERKERALTAHQQQQKAAAADAIENPRVKILLAECQEIEKTSRIELGRRYAELQDIVNSGQLGKNPATGRAWAWTTWAEKYIEKSRSDIHRCITEFVSSGDNFHEEIVDSNVVPLSNSRGAA
jgi:flagellar biosynthesis GTPase FlhF